MGIIGKLLFIFFTLVAVLAANADIIAEYNAAIAAHRGDIEALAAELSTDDYEITGIVTLEFNVAEDGTPDVRLIGSSVAYPPFTDALLTEAESWQLQPHTEAEVIMYKQFVIKNKPYKPAGSIEIGTLIPGSTGYTEGADKIYAGMERTRKSMNYRYHRYLKDYPGSGGFSLLLLYTGGDGYVSRVSTKYTDLEDYTFRGELEGWLKANAFPDDMPHSAVIAFPLSYIPKTGYTPEASIGDYERCLMAYKDILQARYRSYALNEDVSGGAVTVNVEVDTEGNVAFVEIIDAALGDEAFIGLIPDLIYGWRFPPGEGGSAEFTYNL